MYIQEVFANLIIYNFCEMITIGAGVKIKDKKSKKTKKHEYKAKFANAVAICKRLFLEKGNRQAEDTEELIRKNTSPIRPGARGSAILNPKKL